MYLVNNKNPIYKFVVFRIRPFTSIFQKESVGGIINGRTEEILINLMIYDNNIHFYNEERICAKGWHLEG